MTLPTYSNKTNPTRLIIAAALLALTLTTLACARHESHELIFPLHFHCRLIRAITGALPLMTRLPILRVKPY